ncbi:MAG: glycoside hydrolase family 5 protein [Deltaproteobacteria bacterium]|nr:glycoside hydrolase family 5 protein [Deltaproteobacteria bacterium]
MNLLPTAVFRIPPVILIGILLSCGCSDQTAREMNDDDDKSSKDVGNNSDSSSDDKENNNSSSSDDTKIYKDGGCAYECTWDAGSCTGNMNGEVVKGNCTDNQVCCHVQGTEAKRQCLGTCKMQWESCEGESYISEGNCSGAQMICCEDGKEVAGSDQGFEGDDDDDDDDDDDGPVTVTDEDYTIETTWEDVLEEDNTVVEVEGDSITDLTTPGQYRVDENGNITDGGSLFNVRCGNWFGLEGQHEPSDAASNPSGAPMELYVGNMWWAETGRTIQKTMTEIKELGINMIRFPIAPQTLDPSDPQGIGSVQNGGVLKNSPSVLQENARQAMEDFIKLADENDLKVLVDIHSCSNYVGWRAGRLDAAPPWADADRKGYDYTREEYTCASGKDEYNEEKWLANIKEIAGLSEALGVDNIIGIDIFNEPWDYTWAEWKRLSEKAFEAIDSVNPDILIFVEGIGSKTNKDEEIPHGSPETNPNWGENLFNFKTDPLNIPKERLVLSPHTYGPSVYVQNQFVVGSACEGMEGDEAGENDCPIKIVSERLYPGWEEHFGYLRSQGYAMVIGEFGGNKDWPKNTRRAEQEMWSHITTQVDLDWQNAFVDYMIEKNIQACYWAINPESGDTGGIYTSPYRADTNEDAWGKWGAFDSSKTSMLKRYWQGLESK